MYIVKESEAGNIDSEGLRCIFFSNIFSFSFIPRCSDKPPKIVAGSCDIFKSEISEGYWT